MSPVKATVTIIVLAFLSLQLNAQPPGGFQGDPEKMKERVLELKKKKLIEMLDLSSEQESKFIPQYEAGQRKIDEAKKKLDDMIKKLHETARNEKDPEIIAGTDELLRTYDALNAALKDRVQSLKPMLNPKQYAKLLMFEIRFPEVLQKMIMKRGMGKQDG